MPAFSSPERADNQARIEKKKKIASGAISPQMCDQTTMALNPFYPELDDVFLVFGAIHDENNA